MISILLCFHNVILIYINRFELFIVHRMTYFIV